VTEEGEGYPVTVTLECFGRRLEVPVWTDWPVASVVPVLLRRVYGPERAESAARLSWALGFPGGQPFASVSTLAECGVRSGSVLKLDHAGAWHSPAPADWAAGSGANGGPAQRSTPGGGQDPAPGPARAPPGRSFRAPAASPCGVRSRRPLTVPPQRPLEAPSRAHPSAPSTGVLPVGCGPRRRQRPHGDPDHRHRCRAPPGSPRGSGPARHSQTGWPRSIGSGWRCGPPSRGPSPPRWSRPRRSSRG
jgi:WXG100 protein secretion system (Wss), protein YukD